MTAQNLTNFPSYADAPAALLALEGPCGPLATWAALRYYHKRMSAERLCRSCAYTRRYGVFAIAIACTLAEAGLAVDFHSSPDPDIKPLEQRMYRRAQRLGVALKPAIAVLRLLRAVARGKVVIVSYGTPKGTGHFSPLLGSSRGRLLLPYSDTGSMSGAEFRRAWTQAGICQQAVVVAGRRGSEVGR